MNKFKIGLGQLLVEGAEPKRNLERAKELIKEASSTNCNLVLLPECLDLAWTHPSAKTDALSIPGAHSNFLCDLAKKYKIWICAGLTEKDQNNTYNSAILINKFGEIVLKHRKINILESAKEYYQVGKKLEVIETEFGCIGLNICSDNYIESLPIGQALAQMGAQIILSPSSWTVDYDTTEEQDPYGDKWIKPYNILSGLYDIVVIGTTSVGTIVGGPNEGKKMIGCSLVSQNGEVISKGKYNEFCSELIQLEIEIPNEKKVGTEIGNMLRDKGYKLKTKGMSV